MRPDAGLTAPPAFRSVVGTFRPFVDGEAGFRDPPERAAQATVKRMFAITISEKGGETRRLEFDKLEITIGRVQGNDIILPKGNVSKRHSRIVLKDGKFIIVDLKSTNGTYVNGRKITSPIVIKSSDKV